MFTAWKRLWSFRKVIQDIQPLQENLKNISKLGKDYGASTTLQKYLGPSRTPENSGKKSQAWKKIVELQKNCLGHPGTPVDLIIYLQAWKRLWIFYKFTKIIQDLLALQETLQNIYKLEKDSGSSTTSQNFQDLQALQDILKISTSLANIIEFLKNYLIHPGTPGDIMK